MRGSKHVAAIVAISEKDLLISRQLSDAQADHLWMLIEADRESGGLKEVKDAKEVLA